MSIYSPKSTSRKSKSLKNTELKKSPTSSLKAHQNKLRKDSASYSVKRENGLEVVSLLDQHLASKKPNNNLKNITEESTKTFTKERVLTKVSTLSEKVKLYISNVGLHNLALPKLKLPSYKLPSYKLPSLKLEYLNTIFKFSLIPLLLYACYFLASNQISLDRASSEITAEDSQVVFESETKDNIHNETKTASEPSLKVELASNSKREVLEVPLAKKFNEVEISQSFLTTPNQKIILKNVRRPKQAQKEIKLDSEFFHFPLIGSQIVNTEADQTIFLTLNDSMQEMAEGLLDKYKIPWGAIVTLEPKTGKILTLASKGIENEHDLPIALRSGFPAASLFKIVTGAAAIEQRGMDSSSVINYRGGNYTVSKSNYAPDEKRDSRTMRLDSAMGKSVNPVFARLVLKEMDGDILNDYAQKFGFFSKTNNESPYVFPLEDSTYSNVEDDFQLARTAAGFGDVFISPVHAALISAAISNEGVMMQPIIVDKVLTSKGKILFNAFPKPWKRVVKSSTAEELSKMLKKTIVNGTARKTFSRWKRSKKLRDVTIAGKTGTLSGENPKGRYHWFVGTAGQDASEITIAALVVDPGGAKINGTGLARIFLEKYFLNKEKFIKEPVENKAAGS